MIRIYPVNEDNIVLERLLPDGEIFSTDINVSPYEEEAIITIGNAVEISAFCDKITKWVFSFSTIDEPDFFWSITLTDDSYGFNVEIELPDEVDMEYWVCSLD